ncbi:sulfotransferase family protein [Oscillatoria salina]|uniref:sulfotransferase family protein n=1 Tax=Oscillatoria salina TaxID=331517 RepID=UPI0013BAC9C1|nr:sulfotransferase [Oscillatoria salina]MBZ8178758.1 sulfotransferase domain-containing protein [Oscillatoria salina IIICB1]NET90082.1 sulfotransferase domain-containing protein [Kamptonema sp. SIO1D9]
MINKNQPSSLQKKQQKILPDFIIIGAMKSGTTSLYYYLNSHPEISMSRDKELNFFIAERNWQKGLNWYQSQFRGNAKIYGEASPNYTKYPGWVGVPKRMYQVLPHAKLIYILRDPIERIISQYVHQYASGTENRSITEALADFENNPHNYYISRSRYYFQLKQYLEYYSLSQILVLTSEELANYPHKVLSTICRFLEVSDDISSIDYRGKFHRSFHKRRKNALGNAIAELPLMSQLNDLPAPIRFHLDKLIYFPFSTAIKKPKLDQDLRDKLISYLEDDINQLRECTGKEFSDWCI